MWVTKTLDRLRNIIITMVGQPRITVVSTRGPLHRLLHINNSQSTIRDNRRINRSRILSQALQQLNHQHLSSSNSNSKIVRLLACQLPWWNVSKISTKNRSSWHPRNNNPLLKILMSNSVTKRWQKLPCRTGVEMCHRYWIHSNSAVRVLLILSLTKWTWVIL